MYALNHLTLFKVWHHRVIPSIVFIRYTVEDLLYVSSEYLFCSWWQFVVCILRIWRNIKRAHIWSNNQIFAFTFSCWGFAVTTFNNGSLYTHYSCHNKLSPTDLWKGPTPACSVSPLCQRSSHVNACAGLLSQIIVMKAYFRIASL